MKKGLFVLVFATALFCLLQPTKCYAATYAYVPNNNDNTVSVIRTSDNTVTATVNVGDRPLSVGKFICSVELPEAPSSLAASAKSKSEIDLSWTDNSTNESGFKIERKTGSAGTYSQIDTVSADVTSYSDTGRSEATTYYYRVRAYNSAGNSDYSNEANDTTYPAAPSSLSATAASSSQINLSWTDNSSGETGFKIERKTGSGGTYSQIDTVSANVTSYSDTGLSASTNYYYRVRAYNSSGNSSYSNEANATTSAASSSSGGGGGGGGGGSCFIATAAYGSPMETHVTILRDFRDSYLVSCTVGRMIVKTYYRYSPPVANYIAEHDTLKAAVRISLLPLVAISYSTLQLGPTITATALLLIFVLPIFLISAYRMRVPGRMGSGQN